MAGPKEGATRDVLVDKRPREPRKRIPLASAPESTHTPTIHHVKLSIQSTVAERLSLCFMGSEQTLFFVIPLKPDGTLYELVTSVAAVHIEEYKSIRRISFSKKWPFWVHDNKGGLRDDRNKKKGAQNSPRSVIRQIATLVRYGPALLFVCRPMFLFLMNA